MDDQKATVYLPAKVCWCERPQHLRGYSVATVWNIVPIDVAYTLHINIHFIYTARYLVFH